MKKTGILFFVGLMIGFTTITWAADTTIPKWEEFAPSDANMSDIYWIQRKAKFEQSLKQCSPYQGKDLKSCYNQVREAEKIKNQTLKYRTSN